MYINLRDSNCLLHGFVPLSVQMVKPDERFQWRVQLTDRSKCETNSAGDRVCNHVDIFSASQSEKSLQVMVEADLASAYNETTGSQESETTATGTSSATILPDTASSESHRDSNQRLPLVAGDHQNHISHVCQSFTMTILCS